MPRSAKPRKVLGRVTVLPSRSHASIVALAGRQNFSVELNTCTSAS